MKKEAGYSIRLGIFIVIGLILLTAGIYFIGETKKLFSSTFRISALFKTVNGLQVGNNVRFAGINVGTIEGIKIITDSSVQVDMIVDISTKKFIKKDAKAIIGSDGLMGSKIMNISAGTNGIPEVENNDMIGTTTPISIDDMLLKLKNTIDNTSAISDHLSAIIGNMRAGKGTIGKLFMDTVFAGNLDRTIVNVKQGTQGFNQNMDAARNSFLLRGFFKRKDKSAADEKKRLEKEKEQIQEDKEDLQKKKEKDEKKAAKKAKGIEEKEQKRVDKANKKEQKAWDKANKNQ